MHNSYEYIDEEKQLARVSREWNEDLIGVDIECENNLHHYGSYVSIIQLSTKSKNWIVDVLRLKSIEPVISLFMNPGIEKIFHDVGFDLRIIYYQFKVCPVNIFDTEIAAMLLGKKEYGLGNLLKSYFNVKKESKFQMADWSKRPIKKDMLDYAVSDSSYLVALRNTLAKELKEKQRLEWAREEFKSLEKRCWDLKIPTFFDLKGIKLLTPTQRGVAKKLYQLRERIASELNRPVHYVLRNKMVIDLAKNTPESVNDWKHMKGVHPIVKQRASEFAKAVAQGNKEPIILPVSRIKRFTPKQKKEYQALCDVQAAASEKTGIAGSVIISKEQMRTIVTTGKTTSLRKWQARLLEEVLDSPNLRLS